MKHFYKSKEAKSEFIKLNAREIAYSLEEISKLEYLTADGKGTEAIQYCNIIKALKEQKNKIQKLIEAYEIDSNKALDEKDYSIVNALTCYNELIDRK